MIFMDPLKKAENDEVSSKTPALPQDDNVRNLLLLQMSGLGLAALLELIARIALVFWEDAHGFRVTCSFLAVFVWGGVSVYVIFHLGTSRPIRRLVLAGTLLICYSLFQELLFYSQIAFFPFLEETFPHASRLVEEISFVCGLGALIGSFYLSLFESSRANNLLKREQQGLQDEIAERRRAEEALSKSQSALHRANMELELRVKQRTQDLTNANQRLVEEMEQREHLAQSLITSEENYRTLVENANSVIIRWDDTGTILFMNSFGQRFLKYGSNELIGQKVQDTFVLLDSDAFSVEDFAAHILREPSQHIESAQKHICKDGTEVWVSWTHSSVPKRAGVGMEIMSIGHDITLRKKAEMEREQLWKQVLQIQKLESLGLMAGGFAHDFKNMLAIIRMRAELASQQRNLPQEVQFHLQSIQTAIQHSAELIGKLLAFGRNQQVCPMVLDLNKAISENIHMLSPLFVGDLQLVWEPGDDLLPVHIDQSQLNQIVTNIAVNAADALNGKGVVHVSTDTVQLEDKPLLVRSSLPSGQYVKIIIQDTGPGIDPAIESKILEPFFTTKAPGKGTGMGLAVVFGIVKQNNGFLDIRNTPGEGAAFIIYLPACTDRAVAESEKRSASVDGVTKTVCIIESGPDLRDLLVEMLKKAGYTVLAASSFEDAKTLIALEHEVIDLFIINAVEFLADDTVLAEEISKHCPQRKILLMSTLAKEEASVHLFDPEVCAIIEKPFSLDAFFRQVNDLI